MEVFLVENEFGLFALDKKGRILDSWIYSKSPKEAANISSSLKSGKEMRNFRRFLKRLNKMEVVKIVVDDRELIESFVSKYGGDIEYRDEVDLIDAFRKNFTSYAIGIGIVKDEKDLEEYIREFTIETAKAAVSDQAARRDQSVVQMVRTVDDLDKSINVFAGRIREWYGLHFPELDKLIDSHETYSRIVKEIGAREEWFPEKFKSISIPAKKVKVIVKASKTSMGAGIDASDLKMLQFFCSRVLDLYKLRGEMEEHLGKIMKTIAPNINAVPGPLIGARLISITGGLENLAKMPASTIQVLGAEKALFRSLRTGSPPPKHGVIFQYAKLHQSPRWQRGKIARTLAAKIAIASRLDAFGGSFEGDKLKEDFEERLREIEKKYGSKQKIPQKKRGKRKGISS